MKTQWGMISWPPHLYCEPSYGVLGSLAVAHNNAIPPGRNQACYARVYSTGRHLRCHVIALHTLFVQCGVAAMCESALRILFLQRLPSSLFMRTLLRDMSFSTLRPPRVVEVLKRLKCVDLQGLHDASEEDCTALEFLVLHNVAMPIDVPRAPYERQSDKRVRNKNVEAKKSRPNGFSLCMDLSGACFSRAYDGDHVFQTVARRLDERLVEGTGYIQVGADITSFWAKAEIDIISVDHVDRLIGCSHVQENYNPFVLFSQAASRCVVCL